MNTLYIYKITETQAAGKQIDISKKIAIDFFNISEEDIQNHKNVTVNVCHRSDLKTFNQIEIQSATNVRWSTTLNTYLNKKEGAPIQGGDLLVVERIMRSFCVWIIKNGDSKYDALLSLFDKDENSLLLTAFFEDIINNNDDFKNESRQQIFYGAPGTGKSHIINDKTSGESVIRTTFHPDSDYSTFVGSYKPTTKEVPMRDVTGKIIVEYGKDVTEDRIVYEFVEQAFLQAYIQAWKYYGEEKVNKQFLVIEEINRGNCAQIFGDLFQLLDRNEQGFSDYPICADNDMRKQLSKAFADVTFADELKNAINSCYRDGHSKDYAQQVLDGKILLLPNNLYIWATMNTSDQSLFPIDSAFKRRWDWEYMPIKNAEKGWVIEVKDENGTKKYDWWEFIQKINAEIDDLTSSEDKKLGYFFCKAKNKVVSADMFVNKVMFYLWNDLVKDYDLSGRVAFQDDDGKVLTFGKFYENKVRAIEKLMLNLGVSEIKDENDDPQTSNEEASGGVFAVNGQSFKVLGDVVYRAVELFVNNNPTMKDIDVANAWKQIKGTGTGFKYLVETVAEHDARKAISTDARFDNRAKVLTTPMSEILYVSTEWTKEMVSNFMDQVNAQGWEITITKVAE